MTTTKVSTSAEAVRSYLAYLADPDSIRDEKAISAAEKQLESEEDLLVQVELFTKLHALREADPTEVIAAFVANAQEWADETGLLDAQAAFREVHNVPTKVLRDAGFKVRSGPRKGGSRTTRSDVEAHIEGEFTIRAVVEASGASHGSVRTVVKAMVDAGTVLDMGLDPSHDGRGRAATIYKVA